ncbi:hypothetical protein DYB36_011018 [Aphanomyces astaci]|uniref:DDE-1 domain-containing protein n=1 Tax=Aphanomyces astaci TaxID=112090 RepID=A0A397B8S8_APHAT|nr:hypothetical protein DYB36_011018 [Aphanomyces astaci]
MHEFQNLTMSKGTQSRRRAPPRRKPLLKPYRRSTLLAKRKQQSYTIGTIKALLQKHSTLGPCSSDREFARKENVPIATLRGWLARKEEFLQSKKHTSNATLSGHGHSEAVDFGDALASFMDSVRDHEKFLTTAHLVTWLKNHQPAWLDSYLEGKRVPCASKRTQEDLQATRVEYEQLFWSKYSAYDRGNIQYEIEVPSVVVVDNLSAHVTPAACELVRGDLYSVLEELPANATSTVQPLDVGVMGPFKAKCAPSGCTR